MRNVNEIFVANVFFVPVKLIILLLRALKALSKLLCVVGKKLFRPRFYTFRAVGKLYGVTGKAFQSEFSQNY